MVRQNHNPAWALKYVVGDLLWFEISHIKHDNPALYAHIAFVHLSNPRYTDPWAPFNLEP